MNLQQSLLILFFHNMILKVLFRHFVLNPPDVSILMEFEKALHRTKYT